MSHLRLNLGSGNEPLADWVNVDQRSVPQVDVIADVRSLPFPDSSASQILASSLLEHFDDPYQVLDEIHRVLRADGHFTMRVPCPWAQSGLLDKTHVFLADLKLWRQILGGYFETVRVVPEGVRYRDNRLLTAILYLAIRGFRMHEYAQTWRFECSGRRRSRSIAYTPWWLEERYAGGAREQGRS
jgi:ubiquinone/menaquinone biosynthesis C-methylase UbiE